MTNDEMIKEINSFCLQIVMNKNKICKCKIKSCFHSGQLDLALKILKKTGVDINAIKQLI